MSRGPVFGRLLLALHHLSLPTARQPGAYWFTLQAQAPRLWNENDMAWPAWLFATLTVCFRLDRRYPLEPRGKTVPARRAEPLGENKGVVGCRGRHGPVR